MSTEEKETFDTMAKDLAFIKRWWPVLAIFFGSIGFGISGTRWFDHTVATKDDIADVRKDVREVSNKISSIITSQESNKQLAKGDNTHANQRIDSLDKIVYVVEKSIGGHFVVERYLHGRNHDPVLIPATN